MRRLNVLSLILCGAFLVGCSLFPAQDGKRNDPARGGAGDKGGAASVARVDRAADRIGHSLRDAGAEATALGGLVGTVSPQIGLILTGAGGVLAYIGRGILSRRRRRPWTDAERERYAATGIAPPGKPPRPATGNADAPTTAHVKEIPPRIAA